jgi:hypothetical protein
MCLDPPMNLRTFDMVSNIEDVLGSELCWPAPEAAGQRPQAKG